MTGSIRDDPADGTKAIQHLGEQAGIVLADDIEPERGLEIDRGGYGKPGADVARPLEFVVAQSGRRAEFVALVEASPIGPPSPTGLHGKKAVRIAASQIEKAGTGRCEQPF